MNLETRMGMLGILDHVRVFVKALFWSGVFTLLSFFVELIAMVGVGLFRKVMYHVISVFTQDTSGPFLTEWGYLPDSFLIRTQSEALPPIIMVITLLFAVFGFFFGLRRVTKE